MMPAQGEPSRCLEHDQTLTRCADMADGRRCPMCGRYSARGWDANGHKTSFRHSECPQMADDDFGCTYSEWDAGDYRYCAEFVGEEIR